MASAGGNEAAGVEGFRERTIDVAIATPGVTIIKAEPWELFAFCEALAKIPTFGFTHRAGFYKPPWFILSNRKRPFVPEGKGARIATRSPIALLPNHHGDFRHADRWFSCKAVTGKPSKAPAFLRNLANVLSQCIPISHELTLPNGTLRERTVLHGKRIKSVTHYKLDLALARRAAKKCRGTSRNALSSDATALAAVA